MSQASSWEQILDYSNRANPYPFYAELRRTPVTRLPDGTYLVSTYAEIARLLHDPRVSSDITRNPAAAAAGATADGDDGGGPGMTPTFLSMDPPDHDKFRRIAMRHFGPPTTPGRVAALEPRMTEIVTELIDNMAGRTRTDVVDDLAYPLPVTVICELLGVPPGDEHRFRVWVDVALQSTDPGLDPETQQKKRVEAGKELRSFMEDLVEAHGRAPGTDLLSAMAADDGPEGRMPAEQLVSTGLLLLIAGHETTVNLIANGALTLLRHPNELMRLRNDPDLAIPMVEELLRYEPPVHFVPFRTALDDIDVDGTTIPAGASFTLLLAAGNRDPAHATDPDLFIPERPNNQHLGFGGGIHLCFGAPLARLEAQIALTAFATRLENPRLVSDPPPYRPSPFLRGPSHLLIDIDGIAARR
ncbi:cytochrome P450 [Pseudarthrobacter sp. MM222]|uniref:cytochrome P450 n=1 Tax=Pseudarthrobacter sp. MM222 TaxID=3018929 RepID=UPI00221EB531|nr:cytochrome P450 [Pseudarthrobacter sp. MM222]CAI3796908.1 Cytochrome P450 107B1 [Pseudarthrobacter sp. MM222]